MALRKRPSCWVDTGKGGQTEVHSGGEDRQTDRWTQQRLGPRRGWTEPRRVAMAAPGKEMEKFRGPRAKEGGWGSW